MVASTLTKARILCGSMAWLRSLMNHHGAKLCMRLQVCAGACYKTDSVCCHLCRSATACVFAGAAIRHLQAGTGIEHQQSQVAAQEPEFRLDNWRDKDLQAEYPCTRATSRHTICLCA